MTLEIDCRPPVHPGSNSKDYPLTRCTVGSDPTLPELLFAGRYRILRELGRGGMGVVSQARDTRLDRDVAIKVPIGFGSPTSLRRFLREAEVVARLDHPNICRIFDLGESENSPFIVLSFISGQTLSEVVGDHRVDPRSAARMIRSLAKTIQFAHDRGVIHRDLKPANVMIDDRGELVVMDFGLARLEGVDQETRTGQLLGTLPYMSPEQIRGQAHELGKGSDIYSLGVIFYKLVTGRLPFEGTPWEIPRRIIEENPVSPSTIRPGLSPGLDAIIARAMAKKSEDRFGSMTEFADAIDRLIQRRRSSLSTPNPGRSRSRTDFLSSTEDHRSTHLLYDSDPAWNSRRPRLSVGPALFAIGLASMISAGISTASRVGSRELIFRDDPQELLRVAKSGEIVPIPDLQDGSTVQPFRPDDPPPISRRNSIEIQSSPVARSCGRSDCKPVRKSSTIPPILEASR